MKKLKQTTKAAIFASIAIIPFHLLTPSTSEAQEKALFQTETAISAGTSNGGGGGAFKLPDGRLATLPEFGIFIRDLTAPPQISGKVYPRPPQVYEASREVREAVDVIQTVLKFQFPMLYYSPDTLPSLRLKKIITKMDVEPAQYDKAKGEYRELLAAYGYMFEEDKFVLPAYSDNGVTYLFPDFFNKLNDMQRAKYLFHEYTMRETKGLSRMELLARANKIDTLIEEIVFRKTAPPIDEFSILKRFAKLGLVYDQGIFDYIMTSLLKDLKYDLPLVSFIEEPKQADEKNVLDPSFIQEIQIKNNLKTNYAEMLEGTVIIFGKSETDNDYPLISDRCYSSKQIIEGPSTSVKFCQFGITFKKSIRVYKAGPFIKSVVKGE